MKLDTTYLINEYSGIEDVEMRLYHLNPPNGHLLAAAIDYLERSLENEKQNQQRKTVITLIERGLKRLRRQAENLKRHYPPGEAEHL